MSMTIDLDQVTQLVGGVGWGYRRDLYGTVMNEGATKGIFVTTSDYGPDAYDFASDKPLTLMNGANLLHLLEKHGHKAKDRSEGSQATRNGATSFRPAVVVARPVSGSSAGST